MDLSRQCSTHYLVLARLAKLPCCMSVVVIVIDASFDSKQGPVTEEIVFRACILAIYHLAGASRPKMIFLSPLWFGVGKLCTLSFAKDPSRKAFLTSYLFTAHLHHAWDVYNRFGRTTSALKRAVFTTCK